MDLTVYGSPLQKPLLGSLRSVKKNSSFSLSLPHSAVVLCIYEYAQIYRESNYAYFFLFSQYVIKKLNLITSSKRERRSAEQEAQLLSRLRHPNIVMYRESWEGQDCQLYIVMGFCEGGDLYHRLKQQKGELLPERQVVEWFVQIAMALQVCWATHYWFGHLICVCDI